MLIDDTWYIRPKGIRQSTSAGGIVVRLSGGRSWVALVKEGDLPDYILPKGRLEPGETPLQAARREIAEEAGLTDLELVAELGARQRLNYARNRWITVHYFLFLTAQEEGRPTDLQHGYRCEWFPIDRLPSMFWPEQRQLLEDTLPRLRAMAAAAPYTSAKSHRPPA